MKTRIDLGLARLFMYQSSIVSQIKKKRLFKTSSYKKIARNLLLKTFKKSLKMVKNTRRSRTSLSSEIKKNSMNII